MLDIIIIAIGCVISGADGWVEIEAWGKVKLALLRTFLELPDGIPSLDTFGRVFALLDPERFQRGFLTWIATIEQITQGEIIAIDGKNKDNAFALVTLSHPLTTTVLCYIITRHHTHNHKLSIYTCHPGQVLLFPISTK